MKILVWTTGTPTNGDGQFHYRINTPLAEAAYQGLCSWEYAEMVTGDLVLRNNVVVQHRAANEDMMDFFETVSPARDKLVVVEHDDDMLNLREDCPMFVLGSYPWADYESKLKPAIIRSFEMADLITVSVPHLKRVYEQYTDTPIVVLPNTVDEVLLTLDPPVRQPGEPLAVGWAGSGTHDVDWHAYAPAVRKALEEIDAHLMLMGADYRKLIGYEFADYIPWTDNIAEYYAIVNTFHVSLAPLTDDLWNRSKSPLKALEAGALGVPIVASDSTPYRDFVRHGETGFLCKDDEDWTKALRALENDEAMRREMGLNGRRLAAEFTTQKWAPVWIRSYLDALRRKLGVTA